MQNRILFLFIFSFSACTHFNVNAQVFLNGSFENNTAAMCDYNMGNATFTSLMANSTGYGGGQELDIMQSTCPYGPSQLGTWFVGLAAPGGVTDAFTTQLSANLVSGTTYTMSFYDKGDVSYPPGMPVMIGISTVAGAVGTNVYTGPVPTTGVWNKRCFTFSAPNNGSHISISTAGPTRWTHVDNFVIGPGACSILPIELLEFTGFCNNNKFVLNWVTASEKNNDYFEIERSLNGVDFISIGRVKGAGNSYQNKNYSWVEENPAKELYYYRLATHETNRDINYSHVLSSSNCLKNVAPVYEIFPNPANNVLNINIQNFTQNIDLVITNAFGEIVCEKTITQNENSIDLTSINNGLYFIKLKGEEGFFTKKFIKN